MRALEMFRHAVMCQDEVLELTFIQPSGDCAMNESLACAICGGRLDSGRCRVCGGRWSIRPLHRHLGLLALLMGVCAGAFVVTRTIAVRSRELRVADGRVLYDQARTALDEGRTHAAADMFRRAVATDPASRPYRLALARALIAQGEGGEARTILEGLRGERPDEVDATLDLARLEAAEGQWEAALQYYQHTLTALWSADLLDARRAVRIELIEGLLQRGDRSRALSELLILSAGLPDDAETQSSAGRMYLDAGEPDRAQEHFDRALRQDADHAAALAGAAEAAFAQGEYVRARRLLARAPDHAAGISDLRAVTDLVIDVDPLAPRLSLAERRRRLARILEHVAPALGRCLAIPAAARRPTDADLSALREFLETRTAGSRGGVSATLSHDDVGEMFEVAYRAQIGLEEACGAGRTPMDRAVLLIGARHDFG